MKCLRKKIIKSMLSSNKVLNPASNLLSKNRILLAKQIIIVLMTLTAFVMDKLQIQEWYAAMDRAIHGFMLSV